MKFLIYTQYYIPESSSPSVRLSALSKNLIQFGHQVEVFTSLPNHPLGRIYDGYKKKFYLKDRVDNICVHRVLVFPAIGTGFKRLMNYFSFILFSTLFLWKVKRPDIILVNSPPLFTSLPIILYSKLWNIPFIFHIGDLWPDIAISLGLLKNNLIIRKSLALEQFIYKQANLINATTKSNKNTLINNKKIDPDKILYFPNGADINIFMPKIISKKIFRKMGIRNEFIILHAGNLGIVHGLENVLYAAQLIQKLDIHIVFVGGGSKKSEIKKKCDILQLLNITFIQPVQLSELAILYNAADAGLSLFRSSEAIKGTISAKIFPCMASAKPIIFSGIGETADLIEEANAGIIVPPNDPESLANAIEKLYVNPKLSKNLGKNGRNYIEKYLAWHIIVSNWLQQLSEKISINDDQQK